MKFRTLFPALLLFTTTGVFAGGQEISVSLGHLPMVLENAENGPFVDLMKAIDAEYPGNLKMSVYPIPRAISNVIEKKTDAQMPWIKNKLVPDDKVPFRYVTEKMGDVYFVIYSRKDQPIGPKEIALGKKEAKFPYKIETYNGIGDYFDFPTESSAGIKQTLSKILAGRTDAAIFAQEEADFVIREQKLKDVHRGLYDKFDDVIVVTKDARGEELEKTISAIIRKLKEKGTWQKLFLKAHRPFEDWQPYKELK